MEELDKNVMAESPEPEAAPAPHETPAAVPPGGEGEPPVSAELEAQPADASASGPAGPETEVEPAPASPAGTEDGAPALSVDELMRSQPSEEPAAHAPQEDVQLKAVLEAIVYVAEEPLTSAQIAASLHEPEQRIRALLEQLMAEFEEAGHGVCIREIAGGFKMATKPEHHDAVRNFVKSLKPPLKLSLPALETLSVIAYKQPVTGPEIMEIRGVQGGGVLKTLLDRKLIAAAGRKNVIGKPILYKTTKEFLIQFGLKDLAELPSLKEFEEIRRMAFDGDPVPEPAAETGIPAEPEIPAEPVTEGQTEPVDQAAQSPEPDAPAEPVADPAASQES